MLHTHLLQDNSQGPETKNENMSIPDLTLLAAPCPGGGGSGELMEDLGSSRGLVLPCAWGGSLTPLGCSYSTAQLSKLPVPRVNSFHSGRCRRETGAAITKCHSLGGQDKTLAVSQFRRPQCEIKRLEPLFP